MAHRALMEVFRDQDHIEDAVVLIYADDILVASNTADGIYNATRDVMQRLMEAGFKCDKRKMVLGATELVYLGHHISAEGRRPAPQRVQAMKAIPPPTTKKKIVSLG